MTAYIIYVIATLVVLFSAFVLSAAVLFIVFDLANDDEGDDHQDYMP